MRIVERPDVASELLSDWEVRDRAAYQSGGNAVASIKELTLCLRAAWFKRKAGEYGIDLTVLDKRDDTSKLKIMTGVAVEAQLFPDPDQRVEWNTPLGIVSGRMDATTPINSEGQGGEPVENKVTWSKEGGEVSPQYCEQAAGYCLATGKTWCRLVIEHMAGSWGYKVAPKIVVRDLIFTEQELDQFSQEMFRRLTAVLGDSPPSMADHFTWECGTAKSAWQCPYKQPGVCAGGPGKTFGFFVDKGL